MSPSRKGSQRSGHAKRAGKDLQSVTSEFVFVSPPLPLLGKFSVAFFFFSGQEDKLPLIRGVASSPPYWHFFSTESHLPPPTKFIGSGFYSLPVARASDKDIGQQSCCSQSLAEAVTKLVMLKLGTWWPQAKPSNPRTCPSLWSEFPVWAAGRGVWLKLQPLKSPGLSIPVSCKIKRSKIPSNQSTKAFGQWLIIANQSPSSLPAHGGILTGSLCHSWTPQRW